MFCEGAETVRNRSPRQASPARHLAVQAAVALAFVLTAGVGMLFALPDTNIPLIWPAAGLALAVAYRLGPRYLIGIGVGALLAYLLKTHALLPAAAAAAGSVAGAAIGARILRRGGGRLDRLEGIGWLLAAVAAAGTLTSLVGAILAYAAGMTDWGFAPLWWVCWMADVVGALLILPVLLAWQTPGRDDRAGSEALLLGAVIGVVSWAIYANVLPAGLAMARPLSYLTFPLLIWTALRLSVRGVGSLLLLHSAIALYYTAGQQGPFATGEPGPSVLSLHGYLAILQVSILLIAAAVAERRRSEHVLREREAQYRLLVENQTDLILKMDATGAILFASPSVGALLGVAEHALLGTAGHRLLQTGDAVPAAWQWLLEPPHACYLERPLDTVHGVRWIGWAAKAVVEDGGVRAVVAVGRDVTDRRSAEDAARRHLRELAHAGRIGAMGELAAGLAHELNQPLCVITSYSQACLRLLGANADPDLREAMERIADNAIRAGGIIGQMRTFVRKEDPELQTVDANALVEDVMNLVATEARQDDVALQLDLAPALPPIRVAPIQVQQVLVNLIHNAVEAMREGPCERRVIKVATRLGRDGEITLTVTDSGPGLPAELDDQVFEPFVTTKKGGMGLGLSISRSIVESLGGTLTARPAADAGSEFRLTLPSAQLDQTGSG
jgi:two-component system sensor kinase FixL